MKNDMKKGEKNLSYHYPYGDGDCIYLHSKELPNLYQINFKYHERHYLSYFWTLLYNNWWYEQWIYQTMLHFRNHIWKAEAI